MRTDVSGEDPIKKAIEDCIDRGIIEQMIINALTTTGSIEQTAAILRLDEERVRQTAETKEIVLTGP